MAIPNEIVRLKITLDDIKPSVMRRIEVPVSTSLDALHELIQAIMPWENSHMHAFYLRMIDGPRWSPPSPFDDGFGIETRDSTQTTLAAVLAEPNFKVLRYNYDFGDDWRHTIKVERRFSAELWDEYPTLIDAKGRCPPENCGGPWGYAENLDAISDPTHKRHSELKGWFGDFDPKVIDRAAMEAALRQSIPAPQAAKTEKRRNRASKR
jgi:Plasmid pRiA4b ORF-3-like protein